MLKPDKESFGSRPSSCLN